MATLTFRQGIVSHQSDTSNTPTFLDVDGSYVHLVVSPDPTVITFVHGDANYLHTEHVTVNNAWGPLTASETVWLYWELSLVDGSISYGTTNLEPIESDATPTNPTVGQMWFVPQYKVWRVWNGARFQETVRVFAGTLLSGTTLTSMSINSPLYTGTQVGLTTSNKAGALVYRDGTAVRNPGTNTFFTTEDSFLTGVSSAAALKIGNTIITAEASTMIAAYSVVEYSDYNVIGLANPALEGQRLFGIVEEDVSTGEVVSFVTEGIIYNESWDWVTAGAAVNDPIYIDSTGQITRSNPLASTIPVAVVVGRHEILFAPKLFVSVEASSDSTTSTEGLTAAQEAQLNLATSTSQSNAANITVLLATTIPGISVDITTLQTNLASKVDVAGGTLSGKLLSPSTGTTDVATTLVTKDYVDSAMTGYQSTTPYQISDWVGTTTKTLTIPQSTHQLPVGVLYTVVVKDTTLQQMVGVATNVDETTGDVILTTDGDAFECTIRIS